MLTSCIQSLHCLIQSDNLSKEMSRPGNKSFGNVKVKIGALANIKAKNAYIGVGQVNIGHSAARKDQRGDTTFGNIDVEISDTATIEAGSAVIGVQEVNIPAGSSFLSLFSGDKNAEKLFRSFLAERENFAFNADKENEKEVKDFLTREPLQVLQLLKSICLVIGPTSLGTGFLATVPGHDGVILFSAGHNFKAAPEDSQPLEARLKSYKFYFNCLEGRPDAPGSIPVRPTDLLALNPKVVLNTSRRLEVLDAEGQVTTVTDNNLPLNQDYFALILDAAGKKHLADKYGLDQYLECPEEDEWADVEREGPGVPVGERLFYAGYPVIEGAATEGDPLRFSYGNCRRFLPERIQIAYNMDTKGGASGSPVLDSRYKAVAIHTTKDNKAKENRGVVLKMVYKQLKMINAL